MGKLWVLFKDISDISFIGLVIVRKFSELFYLSL